MKLVPLPVYLAFVNDILEGYGKTYLPNGVIYEGYYKNDRLEGFGIVKYINGKYEGEFKNNRREGKGKFFYSKGEIYEGEFKDDNEEGYGIIYFPNGDRYEGEFINRKCIGYGIFYSHLGIQVKRYFKNDFSTKILLIIYTILLALNYLYSRLIKNKMTLLFIIILIIGILIN